MKKILKLKTALMQKQTGRFMFQFDDGDAEECFPVYDYGDVVIKLKQQKKNKNLKKSQQINDYIIKGIKEEPSIEFTSKNGKKLKLFIRDV